MANDPWKEWEELREENARLRQEVKLLSRGLISAVDDDYPWRDGSVASRALALAESKLARVVGALDEYLDTLDNAPDESSTSEIRAALAAAKGE